MRFKIHFTARGVEDWFLVRGENMVEIKKKVDKFFADRDLVVSECDIWSEELKMKDDE